MARTTLNIDKPVLDEVKRIQLEVGGSLGAVVTRLLAEALARHEDAARGSTRLAWTSKPMNALVDLADREAVYAALDAESASSR